MKDEKQRIMKRLLSYTIFLRQYCANVRWGN